jgi:hypothetical protein
MYIISGHSYNKGKYKWWDSKKVYPTISSACKARDWFFIHRKFLSEVYICHAIRNGSGWQSFTRLELKVRMR